jgi:hypothetical protein
MITVLCLGHISDMKILLALVRDFFTYLSIYNKYYELPFVLLLHLLKYVCIFALCSELTDVDMRSTT